MKNEKDELVQKQDEYLSPIKIYPFSSMKRKVSETFEKSKKVKSIGKIRVGGKSERGGSGYAKCENEAKGFIPLPIISTGKKPYSDLSPFNLGPVVDKTTNLKSENFENFWQFQKVYQKVVKVNQKKSIQGKKVTIWQHPEELHVKDSNPNENWVQWRDKGFQNKFPIRRPNGTRKNGLPLYSYYNGKKLSYIEARKIIYIPFYKELARETQVYKDILQMLRDGKNIMLIDLDGPNVKEYPNGREVDLELLKKLEQDEKIIYGHGYVCASALLEDLEKESYNE